MQMEGREIEYQV